jgi:hypothetical protein
VKIDKYPTSMLDGRQPDPPPHGGQGATPGSPPRQEPVPSRPVLETDAVAACDRLVAVLRDASIAWRVVAEGVDDHALTKAMQDLAVRRQRFAAELDNIVASRSRNVGVERNGRTQLLTWRLEARAAAAHGDKDAIIRVCRLGNRAVIEGYNDALGVAMPDSLRKVIAHQAHEVRRTGDWLASID